MNTNRTFSNLINDKPILKSRGYPLSTAALAAKTTMGYPTLAASTLTASGTAVGSVATFTAATNHRLADGQLVEITGATVTAFNGIFKITVDAALNVFTYVLTKTASSTTAGGSPVANYTVIFQQAIIFAPSTNAADVTIGPDQNADMITMVPGDVYVIQSPNENRQDLNDWFYASASAAQVLKVVFV